MATTQAAGPAPYVPARHPGAPGRWGPATILCALRAWVAETGGPPRRQDWSGDRDGDGGAAQRKWMREHPRWPSSSCVAAHFGSWGAALQEAGLPARRLTFDSTVAERVEAARRLAAAGWTAAEIAVEIGVSASSVGNYLRARACPDCGGPVTSPRAARCGACTAHEPTIARAWTSEGVRAAIVDWCAEHGCPPAYHDWTPSRESPGRWEAESPRWPSAAVVCDLYGDRAEPWNAALVDAGVGTRMRRWSDEAIRAALAAHWARVARPPGPQDVRDPSWPGPCAQTLRRRFGGVEHAWRTLGPAPEDASLGEAGR